MTRTSIYNRVVVTIVLILLIVHAYLGHVEHGKIIDALSAHQSHSINAFSQINNTLAKGIAQRVDSQVDKDQEQIVQRTAPAPTPTPVVVTKTRVRTRIIRPTPKPFKLFGK